MQLSCLLEREVYIINYLIMEERVINNIIPSQTPNWGGNYNGGFDWMGGIWGILIWSLLAWGRGLFWGNGWGGTVGWPAAAWVAAEVVLTPTLNAMQNQINGLGQQLQTNSITDTAHDIAAQSTSQNTSILGAIANLSTAQANGNFTTLQSVNDLGRDVAAQANQNALQQLNSFNLLTTTTLQGFNSQAMQTQNATNQIIAGQTALSSQLAACCCELKEAINHDGQATRALLTSNRMDDLQNALNEARLAASQANQTAAIVSALSGNGNGNGNN